MSHRSKSENHLLRLVRKANARIGSETKLKLNTTNEDDPDERSESDGFKEETAPARSKRGFSTVDRPFQTNTDDDITEEDTDAETMPIVDTTRGYNTIDRPFPRKRFSTAFMRKRSIIDRADVTAYFASVTQSLHMVSKSMYLPGSVGAAFSSKTLSMADVPSDDRSISSTLLFFTILNMIILLSMFALPFIVVRAGLSVLVTILVVGLLTMYTSLLVHTCQYQTSSSHPGVEKRVYSTYIELGKKALEPYGETIMRILVVTNLLGDVSSMVFLAQVTITFFSNPTVIATQLSAVVWGVALLPLLFISKMSILIWIATVGMVAYIISLGMIYVELVTLYKSWSLKNLNGSFDWEYFLIGYGVVLNTYNCHILLPATEACAKRPEKYRTVVKATFTVNIVMKLLLAGMATASYGASVSSTLLTDMNSFGIVNKIVNVLFIIYLYSNRPRSIFVVAEMLDHQLQPKMALMQKETKGHYAWMFLSRSILALIVVFLAIAVPEFDLVAGFVGCVRGTTNAVALPLAIYLRLKGRHISKLSYVAHATLLVLGLLIGLLGTAITVKAMLVKGE